MAKFPLVAGIVSLVASLTTTALDGAEPVKHASGFTFPKAVASFQRQSVNTDGQNISVKYSDRKAPAAITISIVRASAPYSQSTLRKHVNESVRQLNRHGGGVQRVLEQETKPRGKYRGFGGMYSYIDIFAGKMQQVISFIMAYHDGDWIVRIEETYPDASAETAPGPIGKFRDAWGWPK